MQLDLRRPSLLLVEDDRATAHAIIDILRKRFTTIRIDFADSIEEAHALLDEAKHHEMATKAILATTSFFTKDARDFLAAHSWELEPRDQEGVLDWVKQLMS